MATYVEDYVLPPITFAISNKYYDEAIKLINEHLDEYDYIVWLFIKCAEDGEIEMLKYFIQSGIDPNIINNDGFNALNSAIFYHQIDTIKYLLDNGANIHQKAESQFTSDDDWLFVQLTPLELADRLPPNPNKSEKVKKIIKILLEYGAELPDTIGNNIQIVLHEKEMEEMKEKIKQLEDENEELRLRPPIKGGDLYQNIERDFYKELKNIDL